MNKGRIIAFIDNSNFFRGQLKAKWKVDMKKLYDYLQKESDIWQTFFFASVTDPPKYAQTGFYKYLKNQMRFEVKLYTLGRKTTKCKNCKCTWMVPVEKGVDVGLATKMLSLANNKAFDTAILIAADKDYLETIQEIKNQGIHVEIVAWRGSISSEMEAESSRPVIYFDEIRSIIESTEKTDKDAESLTAGEIEPAS